MQIMYSGKEPVGFDSGGKQTCSTYSYTSTVPLVVSAVHRSIRAGLRTPVGSLANTNTRAPRRARVSSCAER